MPKIRPRPRPIDVLRALFIKAEQDILNEILRKNTQGYVDYAETAAMERVQATLQGLVDESWEYVPQVIKRPFEANLSRQGYSNARELTSAQTVVVEQLIQNLMVEIIDSTNVAYNSARNLYQVARLDNDIYRQSALASTAYTEALGKGAFYAGQSMEVAIRNHGITAFVDKRGRQWSLTDYCSMATRTTAHQAEVSAVLTKDDHDLYQIVKIGSTCPICAPLEGRVYSKSGMDPNYPPLSLAFGKIDPAGGDDLSNTYLCIHPNCYHTLIRYTEMGKTDKQIQKMRDFSNPETNPLDVDPRSKKQIEAYRTKERNRAKLRNDIKQMNEYRDVLGSRVPKDIGRFRALKYDKPEKWQQKERAFRTVRELGRKESWTDEFRNKAINTYFELLDKNIEFSGHGMGRLLDRVRKGEFSIEDIIRQSKQPFNYIQKDGKKIKYYNKLTMIYNESGTEVVSVVFRNNKKDDWNESV